MRPFCIDIAEYSACFERLHLDFLRLPIDAVSLAQSQRDGARSEPGVVPDANLKVPATLEAETCTPQPFTVHCPTTAARRTQNPTAKVFRPLRIFFPGNCGTARVEAERRLSPEQEAELKEFARRLGIEPPLDENYPIYRELWAAEHNERVYLPLRDVPIQLRADEQCCFAEPAVWRQPGPHNSGANLSCFSMAFPLTKLASYRMSGISSRHRALDGSRELATGSLYITNFKLFFDSGGLSTAITFNGLANIECYANGIEVGKSNGRTEFFQMTRLSSEYAYMIVQELNRQR